MRVAELWRYPVKSLGGESLANVNVSEIGLEGDRRWGLVDLATGRVLTAKRDGRLLAAAARLDGKDGVVISLPDGTETADDTVLSKWLEKDVALQSAGAEGGHFENPRDFENETDWVFWQGPPHAWHDVNRARVSLISTSSLGAWNSRRFRSNVILSGEGEDALVGRRVRLGTVELSIEKRLSRCVVVTRVQPGLELDLDVLRTINKELGGYLAVGALVESGGSLTLGDSLTAI